MSNWYLAKDTKVLKHNNKALTVSDRIPYIDIQCPAGFDPQTEGCGKSYGSWTQINVSDNVWRFECKYSKWHDLFYNNRSSNLGDFRSTDGEFACVGSGNTDLIIYMDGLFRSCTGLVSCTTIDTSNCVNLSAMFAECSSLTAVPYLDTRQNRDFNNFVVSCTSLVSINEDIDTSNGRCFWWMCYGCTSLETVPTIDLRNADDTWQSEFARRGGNDHMFTWCRSLQYVHLIGGAGIASVNEMFHMSYRASDAGYQKLAINWENCYLPLVTGTDRDLDGNADHGMFDWDGSNIYSVAKYYSMSSMNMPNLVGNVHYYIPQAIHVGNLSMPKVVYNYRSSLKFSQDMESVGSIDFGHEQPVGHVVLYRQMFYNCNKLSNFPDIQMPVPSDLSDIPDLSYMFTNTMYPYVPGAYAFYQYLVSKGYDTHPSAQWNHQYTFYNCNSDTWDIPANWKQQPSTGP